MTNGYDAANIWADIIEKSERLWHGELDEAVDAITLQELEEILEKYKII